MKGREVVLGVLMTKDRSGYEIKEVFNQVFSHFFDASYGMIYPTLKSLEKDKLIEKEIIYQEGKPNKNMYKITKGGKDVFLKYMNSPLEKDIVKSDFLMRMYFGEYLEEGNLNDFIDKQISLKHQLIDHLMRNHKEWKDHLTLTQQLSFDIGIAQYQAEIKVLENYKHNFDQ